MHEALLKKGLPCALKMYKVWRSERRACVDTSRERLSTPTWRAPLMVGLPRRVQGEQHGFRKAENIEDALNSELYFYSRVFGFECAGDEIKPFPIDNLPSP